MHRIDSFYHEHKNIPLLIRSSVKTDMNSYTVIVGKNGVGKSRLLSNMVNELAIIERYDPRE